MRAPMMRSLWGTVPEAADVAVATIAKGIIDLLLCKPETIFINIVNTMIILKIVIIVHRIGQPEPVFWPHSQVTCLHRPVSEVTGVSEYEVFLSNNLMKCYLVGSSEVAILTSSCPTQTTRSRPDPCWWCPGLSGSP